MNSPAPAAPNNSNFVASKTPVNYLPPPAQKRPAMPVTQTKLTPDSPIGALLPTQITYAGHGNQHQHQPQHQHQQSGGTPGNVTKSLVNITDLRDWKINEVPKTLNAFSSHPYSFLLSYCIS